ncbi:uncharacterized protein [Physcomitrium patens]|uniref:Protein kinase domain-containing protein n=1 Tax=Physcomitrium patens TaxID=3218 RepID=A0A2K1IVB2_PHYPA|nr:uncharacterized aarF domain-containing protein kinase At1g71810, chloroplastic-like isoform X2 [Physcomitrium patens]PNR33211.1 hypothetical protein PHYPA_025154 [Physcomitrium patens]|eukprot:XP_024358168.1 uncharacterized aarF domain-containing protein kinase At1g71810, chloroplastic-like isoform X2 [Physcomitrella patens]
MAASITPGSNPSVAMNCVASGAKGCADVEVGFPRLYARAQGLMKVRGGSSCLGWSSRGNSFIGGQVVSMLKQGAGSRNRMSKAGNTQAILKTNSKETPLISVEIQRNYDSPFETVDKAWLLDREPNLDELRRDVMDSGMVEPILEENAGGKVHSEVTLATEKDIEMAMAKTAGILRDGKSSLGTKGVDKDEFQSSNFEDCSARTDDDILEEAVAEAAKVLHEKRRTFGRKLVHNEVEMEVQDALMETVQVLRSGQSSFLRKSPSNAQKRKQFWDKLKNSDFGKTLEKDGTAIKSWLQAVTSKRTATPHKKGVANIVANDIDFIKSKSTRVRPSLRKKIGEIVALKIIEDENSVPAGPAFWPEPYYPELRGKDLLDADLRTLESYSSFVQGVFQSFKVPLQNEYDPDQVAAYFHRRPHVLLLRFLEVGAAFGSVALERNMRMAALKRNKMGEISEADKLKVTLQTAESLKKTLLGLGTTFIKVAQSLSSRPDLIGAETAKVLSELQDRLPPFPKDEAIEIIEEELGCKVSEAFSFLSDEPVAAASFGQVYRGRTKCGEDVAVKVQRRNLQFNVARDVYILRIGFMILGKVAKLNNNYTILADEIGQGLYGELNYRQEAANAAEFAMAHKHIPWLYVPKTLPHMTKRKVLVMEWLNGDRPFDLLCISKGLPSADGTLPSQDVQQEARRRLLNMVNKGTEAALTQLLETGVMHADPHPGNILLGRDGKLQFIDFGLITRMDKIHQGAMLAAIAHLVNGDWQSLTDDLADMDVLKPRTDRFALRLALERAFGEGSNAIVKDGVPNPNFSFNKVVNEFFKIAYKFRFRLPPYYILVLRSLASLEGFGLAVDPNFKTFGAAYPYAVRRILLHYSPITQRVLRSLLLTEKREFKWDRISSLIAISQKSAAQRAALETVTFISNEPKVEPVKSEAPATTDASELSIRMFSGLLLSKEGVGIRRVMYEADARDLACTLISARAAKVRRTVAERLGETLFSILKERCNVFNGKTKFEAVPLSKTFAHRITKDRRLQLILKSMVGRLRSQPILLARVGWASFTVALWAMALAFHDLAICLCYEYLKKAEADAKRKAQIRTTKMKTATAAV